MRPLLNPGLVTIEAGDEEHVHCAEEVIFEGACPATERRIAPDKSAFDGEVRAASQRRVASQLAF
ncbi:MAG: hypothetical protein AAFR47_19450 [Pseudomonadota bacterium]